MRSAKRKKYARNSNFCLRQFRWFREKSFNTGLPFLEHMLDQIARHGMFDIDIEATGDLEIDAHHTVEDIGITLVRAFAEAVGDKRGFGVTAIPMCR